MTPVTAPAPDAALVTARYRPLARSVAAPFVARFPSMADDLESDALVALWRAAVRHAGTPAFVAAVRQRVRRACRDRVRVELRRDPSARGGERLDVEDLVDGRELPPGTAAEAAELLALLPPARRAEVEMVLAGHPLAEVAERSGVSKQAATLRVRASLDRLRRLARC